MSAVGIFFDSTAEKLNFFGLGTLLGQRSRGREREGEIGRVREGARERER